MSDCVTGDSDYVVIQVHAIVNIAQGRVGAGPQRFRDIYRIWPSNGRLLKHITLFILVCLESVVIVAVRW